MCACCMAGWASIASYAAIRGLKVRAYTDGRLWRPRTRITSLCAEPRLVACTRAQYADALRHERWRRSERGALRGARISRLGRAAARGAGRRLAPVRGRTRARADMRSDGRTVGRVRHARRGHFHQSGRCRRPARGISQWDGALHARSAHTAYAGGCSAARTTSSSRPQGSCGGR